MSYVVPLISALVSLVFALAVLDQYFARRQPFQLVWGIGLLLYCVATATEFWAEAWGLNPTIYRLWYLFGAFYVAAYLGMGTIWPPHRPVRPGAAPRGAHHDGSARRRHRLWRGGGLHRAA